ncbi:zinc finger, CCHC-type containing protein [Tanacetum coccineum]
MLSDKDTTKEAWATLRTMHMGAEPVKEAKVQTLRSDFKVIHGSSRSKRTDKRDSSNASRGKGGSGSRVRGRGQGRGRGRGRDDGHDLKTNWNDQKHVQKEKGKIKCFSCEEFAHYASECPKKRLAEKATSLKKVTANLLLTGEPRVESNVWYLDNGASNHMTEDRSKFHELDKSVSGRVKFEDGSIVAIMGKGSVLFDCKNGDQRLLNEVTPHVFLQHEMNQLGSWHQDLGMWFWVYMLNGKFEAFEAFKWYKKMVEESSGEFLGEVVRHAIYLLNRLPSKSLLDITPYEDWMLRVSRDVVFDEKECWDWCKSMEEERPIAATFTVINHIHTYISKLHKNSPQTTHNQPEAPEFENVFSGQPYQEDVEANSDLNIAAIDPFSSPSTHSSNSLNAPRPRGFRP